MLRDRNTNSSKRKELEMLEQPEGAQRLIALSSDPD